MNSNGSNISLMRAAEQFPICFCLLAGMRTKQGHFSFMHLECWVISMSQHCLDILTFLLLWSKSEIFKKLLLLFITYRINRIRKKTHKGPRHLFTYGRKVNLIIFSTSAQKELLKPLPISSYSQQQMLREHIKRRHLQHAQQVFPGLWERCWRFISTVVWQSWWILFHTHREILFKYPAFHHFNSIIIFAYEASCASQFCS